MNAVTGPGQVDASDLVATIERARALFDDGDLIAAKLIAGVAYDQAKTAAQYAERFGAAEMLVRKAHQLQGDALLIETRAKIRLADEYDAAQADGKASKGRPKNLPEGKTFTVEEAGLTHKEIHEARKLRDAERKTPGIAERAIAARLAQGLEPTKANLRAAVGTSTATAQERGHNLYETPREAVLTLLALERFDRAVLEPACGRGAISGILEAAGHEVDLWDLVDRSTATRDGEVQRVCDFLTAYPLDGTPDQIITNPPYGADMNAFIARALRVHKPRKMALLLNLNVLAGFEDPARNFYMDEWKPRRVIVFPRRLPMMHRDGWDGPIANSRMNTAWFVWEATGDDEKPYGDTTTVDRVDWKDFEDWEPAGGWR
ncbi:SAM-dependent methyltransferase [Zhengella mangrovi]|uniref:SAM-dependent methyltransferase n=1 Tax=Zhengella mangrovi TaxID=1982044 RepID=A0A2G1QRU7_9HYPH|nr:SAM-dependent methyltransferase [Zhengella mangrovi]PHP68201.1 SAM-dependent methyltransferase [Zhengella mangrovi]